MVRGKVVRDQSRASQLACSMGWAGQPGGLVTCRAGNPQARVSSGIVREKWGYWWQHSDPLNKKKYNHLFTINYTFQIAQVYEHIT